MSLIVITGGSGLVGTAVSSLFLAKGHEIVILTRQPPRALAKNSADNTASGKISYARWDIGRQSIEAGLMERADYVIHLAGAGVADKRWTAKRKKEIVDSRTQSSALIVKALKECDNNVRAVISASAIGWYGADPVLPNFTAFAETDPPDNEFLGETCKRWEESIEPVAGMGKRLVTLRTGIVLSNEGGALAAFTKPLQFGLAAILGSGVQVISWLHIDDLCRMYLEAVENEDMQGVYNAVAPQPVTNKALTLQLGHAIRGKAFIPVHVPAWVLKLIVGEMSTEVLKSATVSADKIRGAGFHFLYPSLESALNQLIVKK